MPGKNQVVRLGFIGTGGFVTGKHLPNAHRNPNLEIRALCDLREDVLSELSRTYHPKYVTTDMKELCKDPDIDAVIIGTRENVRVEPIRAAAEAGKHILVEKPMSRGWDDTRQIVDIINRTGVFLMVGFNRPYSQSMQDAREAFRKVRGDETLIYYRLVAEKQLWPMVHQDMVNNNEESTIVFEVVHIFDLLNWLIEEYPTAVFTAGGRSDNNAIVLEYPHKTTVTMLSGSCGTEAYPKERLEVFTNYTTIVMDCFVELISAGEHDFGDKTYPLENDPLKDLVEGEGPEALRLKSRHWYTHIPPEDRKRGYYYTSRPGVNKGHYNELEHFRNCIVNNVRPETDHVRGAVATLTGLKALESPRERRFIDLDFSEFLT